MRIISLNEPFNPPDFVGGFFPRKGFSIIASKAGMGKTWYICQLLSNLSTGGDIFLSQSYYEPQRRCLFFVGETGEALVIDRFRSLEQEPCIRNIGIVSAQAAAKEGILLDLDSGEGATVINKLIKEYKPDIVVFDTLMSFRRGDENSSQQTNDACRRMMTIARDNNCAIIATHHLRKTNRMFAKILDQDDIIGSSSLVRNAATAFVITKKQGALSLHCVKSWWQFPSDINYEMVSQNGKVIFRIKDPEEDWTKPRLRVQEFLEKHRQDAFTVEELMNKCSVSKQTVYTALKAMGLKPVGEKVDKTSPGPAGKLYTAGMEDRQLYLGRS